MKHIYTTLIALYVGVFSISTFAQSVDKLSNESEFGDYVVRHVVFNSTFLLPEVAKTYQLKRSKYESVLNIALSKKDVIGSFPATVKGTVKNLMQQQKTLDFQEISEKNATYYLAPVRVGNEELLHFSIEVSPKDSDETFTVTFSQTVYADE